MNKLVKWFKQILGETPESVPTGKVLELVHFAGERYGVRQWTGYGYGYRYYALDLQTWSTPDCVEKYCILTLKQACKLIKRAEEFIAREATEKKARAATRAALNNPTVMDAGECCGQK